MRASPASSCVCGHPADSHRHYRRGSDCSLCDCPRLRRRDSFWRRLLGR
ncbi:hypothetical protein [Kineococcus aurantiacus]|uniref:Uncharacterized protein n=1 Tax=Kineococcus aurantiacus TaxID=37633 RepID=A0A7Y9DHV1_9ACTN|nr:hypothetical protein [Kineococcus aurantiacus]NYD20740.1 hypothetical protein [Kineococcus aurantiacus]